MGFSNNSFAKVWGIENKGNYSVVDMSISKKNKETEQYEVTFKHKWVRFIGEAHKKVQNISRGASIKLISCDVEYTSKKNDDGSYTNYFTPKVFDFEMSDGSSVSTEAAPMPDLPDFMNDDYNPFN